MCDHSCENHQPAANRQGRVDDQTGAEVRVAAESGTRGCSELAPGAGISTKERLMFQSPNDPAEQRAATTKPHVRRDAVRNYFEAMAGLRARMKALANLPPISVAIRSASGPKLASKSRPFSAV